METMYAAGDGIYRRMRAIRAHFNQRCVLTWSWEMGNTGYDRFHGQHRLQPSTSKSSGGGDFYSTINHRFLRSLAVARGQW